MTNSVPAIIMEASTLEGLLRTNNLPGDVLLALASPPYHIISTQQFANFFDSKAEVGSAFCTKVDLFKECGDLVATLKQA